MKHVSYIQILLIFLSKTIIKSDKSIEFYMTVPWWW